MSEPGIDEPAGVGRSRPVRLSDGMVLIAGAAAGLAWSSRIMPFFADGPFADASRPFQALFLLIAAIPGVLGVNLALLGLRLHRPRPPLRGLFRQPGALAALVLPLSVAASLTTDIALSASNGTFGMNGPVFPQNAASIGGLAFDFFVHLLPPLGRDTAIAWLALALSGGWQAERSWIDRLGRALGAFWIVTLPLFLWIEYGF